MIITIIHHRSSFFQIPAGGSAALQAPPRPARYLHTCPRKSLQHTCSWRLPGRRARSCGSSCTRPGHTGLRGEAQGRSRRAETPGKLHLWLRLLSPVWFPASLGFTCSCSSSERKITTRTEGLSVTAQRPQPRLTRRHERRRGREHGCNLLTRQRNIEQQGERPLVSANQGPEPPTASLQV